MWLVAPFALLLLKVVCATNALFFFLFFSSTLYRCLCMSATCMNNCYKFCVRVYKCLSLAQSDDANSWHTTINITLMAAYYYFYFFLLPYMIFDAHIQTFDFTLDFFVIIIWFSVINFLLLFCFNLLFKCASIDI